MEYSLDFASSGLNLGNLAAAPGRPGGGRALLPAGPAVDDLFLPAKMNLAVLLSGQGRNDEAEALLREAADAYPDNCGRGLLPGAAAGGDGPARRGAGLAAPGGGPRPRGVRIRYNLGLLLQQAGRLDEAEAALDEALELEPDDLACCTPWPITWSAAAAATRPWPWPSG